MYKPLASMTKAEKLEALSLMREKQKARKSTLCPFAKQSFLNRNK